MENANRSIFIAARKSLDYDISPGAERFEKVMARSEQPWTACYFIVAGNQYEIISIRKAFKLKLVLLLSNG